MRAVLLGCSALLLSASPLLAQDNYEEEAKAQAEELRAQLDCPTDTEWPPLPEEGYEVFRPAVMDPSGESAIMLPDSMREGARPDIAVPQYAWFYDAAEERCRPVIVLQAEGPVIGYKAILTGETAAWSEHFFYLLGTEPPQQ